MDHGEKPFPFTSLSSLSPPPPPQVELTIGLGQGRWLWTTGQRSVVGVDSEDAYLVHVGELGDHKHGDGEGVEEEHRLFVVGRVRGDQVPGMDGENDQGEDFWGPF